MGARVYFAASFDEPLIGQTSGWEQGSIYTLWRVIHGLEIYQDRFSYPYSVGSYNWLFLMGYGAITKGTMHLLSLGDAWIPMIARSITLSGICLGIYVAYRSLVTAIDIRDRDVKLLALSFAVFIMTGPLIGFSAFTVRPDTWAMVFEIAAVWLFWSSWRRHKNLPLSSVIGISILVIAAWSFKQTHVFALGGIGLFLLYKRHFKALIVLSLTNISYWAAIIALGGPNYIQNIFFTDYPMTYAVGHAWDIFVNFAVKSTPSLAGAAGLAALFVLSPRVRRLLRHNDPLLFALAGLSVSSVMVLPMSMQDGASENYYYVLSYFLAFSVLAGFHALANDGAAKWFRGALSIGWLGLIVAVSAVLTGHKGIISVHPSHVALMKAKQCLVRFDLPKPLFIKNDFLSLPWMVPGAEPFVLSYVYYRERATQGHRFERGGIGGLIKTRHFASIVLPGKTMPEKVDGAALGGYTPLTKSCPDVLVLLRNTAETPR